MILFYTGGWKVELSEQVGRRLDVSDGDYSSFWQWHAPWQAQEANSHVRSFPIFVFFEFVNIGRHQVDGLKPMSIIIEQICE
jgi:hypothetical protein